MNKKFLVFHFLLICILLSSCATKLMGAREQKEYTIALKDGDLERVQNIYKEFGKSVLNNYGIEGIQVLNPLEVAVFGHSFEVADFLIKKGADVNAISPQTDQNIILTFVYQEDIEAIKYLISKGARIKGLVPPITTAITYSNNLELIKLLNNTDFDINEKDRSGFSAKYIASDNGNLDAIKYLLSIGADINIKNNDDDTPLLIALANGHVEIAEYLISQGADISIKDSDGLDALWFANELNLKVEGLNR